MRTTVTRVKQLYSNGLIVTQATGVLEATIKGTTSSFMKNITYLTKNNTRRTHKSQEHSSLIPREYSESFKVLKST